MKLAVCIYVAGWIADRSDFDTTWAGCVPESSDAGGCRECRGAGQLLYLQDSCAAMRPKLAVGQCMRAWSTVLPLPSNLPVLLPCPPADSFTLVWETKVLLHLNSALGKLLTMQAAGQSLQLATHSFFYAGAGGRRDVWLAEAFAFGPGSVWGCSGSWPPTASIRAQVGS